MTEDEIKFKLDLLEEFHAQIDALELAKRSLLEEVKAPAEVDAVVKSGWNRVEAIEREVRAQAAAKTNALRGELEKIEFSDAATNAIVSLEERLAAIVIPEEIRTQIAEIDRQRAEISAEIAAIRREEIIRNETMRTTLGLEMQDVEKKMSLLLSVKRAEIQADVDAQTREVYDALAQRKLDIEDEFAGKKDAAKQAIAELENEIREGVKEVKKTVKGKFWRCEYAGGHVTWDEKKLDEHLEECAWLKDARHEGDPYTALKRIK